jgi:hypothetical protein
MRRQQQWNAIWFAVFGKAEFSSVVQLYDIVLHLHSFDICKLN